MRWLSPAGIVLGTALLCAACDSAPAEMAGEAEGPAPRLRLGADRIFEDSYLPLFKDKKVGLITNHTGLDSDFVPTLEKFASAPGMELTALFGPEHGLYGSAQAGEKVASGPRIFSLYGDTRSPTPEMLGDVEVLVYDIQDVGVRFYTYISTMAESLRAAARQQIPFVVLDRPVPISGTRVEGPVLERGFESFVGIHPIPIRYGMTAGEIARFLNQEAGIGADLTVVPLTGWVREQWFDQTGLEWIAPSPNMPTLQTATVYPGFCLIEGTNLSEGRGTTRPFEWIGAPWLSAHELAEELNSRKLPGVYFRPQAFTPTFSKFSGELCQGVQVHVLDREAFQPIPAMLHFLSVVIRLHPDNFAFRPAAFDRLMGNSWVREMLEKNQPTTDIHQRWLEDLEVFEERRRAYLLY